MSANMKLVFGATMMSLLIMGMVTAKTIAKQPGPATGHGVLVGLLGSGSLDKADSLEAIKILDNLSSGSVSKLVDRYRALMPSSSLSQLSAGQALRSLDKLSSGSLVKSFDLVPGARMTSALEPLTSASKNRIEGKPKVKRSTQGGLSRSSLNRLRRNFDEIDSSAFSGFGKRDFDEIDRSAFAGFTGKRNFDQIDRSGFGGFAKRNFDEIDRSELSGFAGKRNFDEIDRSGFAGFAGKRNFDEINRSAFGGFLKRSQSRDAPAQSVSTKT